MLLLSLIALLFVSVPLTGGRLERLADLDFRGVRRIVGALAVQILIIVVLPGGDTAVHRVVHIATYAAGGVFLWANRHIPGMLLLGFGALLNAVAITANNGVMPASSDGMRDAGLTHGGDGTFSNSAPLEDARLSFLGDVLAVPSWVPDAKVFSVGDVVIMLGAIALVHVACRRPAAQPGVPAGAAPAAT